MVAFGRKVFETVIILLITKGDLIGRVIRFSKNQFFRDQKPDINGVYGH